MTIWDDVLRLWAPLSQRRAEREALRLLVARGDMHLLRDAGLSLNGGGHPRYEPLPRAKERRWTAPLIRLPPPFPRIEGETHRSSRGAPKANKPAA